MEGKWTETFEDFGRDPYLPFERAAPFWLKSPSSPKMSFAERTDFLKRQVAKLAPRHPGVYGMIDESGRLIYVGKSKLLRNRLLSYFMPNNEDEKAGRIVQSASSIVWELQPSEFSALLREQWLIRTWLPRMNVVGMPNRQKQAFLCIGKGPGESFYLSKYFDSTARFSVGPFLGVGDLHRAVEVLTRYFKLRDCSAKTPMFLTGQLTLFDLEQRAGCIRQELKNCLAPCTSACSRIVYQQQVDQAIRFLQGDHQDVASDIESTMLKASQAMQFEHAARLRDDLRIVRWLSRRLSQFRRARNDGPTLYCLTSSYSPPLWYLLRQGGVVRVLSQPATAKDWQKALAKLNSWRNPAPSVGQGELVAEDSMGLVTMWLQKRSKRHKTDEIPQEMGWLAPADEIPTAWKDAKEWIRDKQKQIDESLSQSIVAARSA